MIGLPPRSRRVRLYLFEGGAARATNAGPGRRVVVLPWADLDKITSRFDDDDLLTSCELRGHSGTKLGLLGVPFSGFCDKFQAAAPSRALVT